jgi:hypothetical protein
VHGNGAHALGALGGSVASNRRDRGGVHAAAQAVVIQGIDHGGQHEPGGEVTWQEVVGGALPRSDALGGHGDAQGGVGCLCNVSAWWGWC